MERKITLFSTHCSHCRVVSMKLDRKGIKYEEIYIDPQDPKAVQTMTDMGLQSAPGLVVDGKVMGFTEALSWIKEQ